MNQLTAGVMIAKVGDCSWRPGIQPQVRGRLAITPVYQEHQTMGFGNMISSE